MPLEPRPIQDQSVRDQWPEFLDTHELRTFKVHIAERANRTEEPDKVVPADGGSAGIQMGTRMQTTKKLVEFIKLQVAEAALEAFDPNTEATYVPAG